MIRKLFVALSLAWLAAAAWALPTVEQVQSEVQRGNYSQAEVMMREVVAAKPGSAKAHYLYAEILAHNGSFAKAADEARQAKQIDPLTKFTQPEKFRAFEALLARELNPVSRAQPPIARQPAAAADEPPLARSWAIPSWVWLAGLALVGVMLWRAFSRSRAAGPASPMSPAAGPPNPAGYPAPAATGAAYGNAAPYGSGMPYGQPAPSIGGGLLGTGLAVAGGVAAGMLVDEMLHRRATPGGTDHLSGLGPQAFDAPFVEDSAARELENRPIDFGNGADWDAGSAGDGAASDTNDTSDDGGWG